MSVDYHAIAFAGLASTILLVLIVEFVRSQKIARFAARIAIVASLITGVSWSYAIYLKGYVFSPYEAQTKSRSSGGTREIADTGGGGNGGAASVRGRSGGAAQEDGDDGEGANGDGGGLGQILLSGRDRGAGGVAGLVEQMIGVSGRRASDKAAKDVDGEVKRDCEGCPEMVIIAGGTALIGAPDSDPLATIAERPQRQVRIWPGFAISRGPIDEATFAAFRVEEALAPPRCPSQTPPVRPYARCLTANEAERFTSWLSARTGLHFRLATAIEWEYAARTRGVSVLAAQGGTPIEAPLAGIGEDLAEMTADCFDPYVPTPGRERRALEANPLLCQERVLKGARAGEDTAMRRFSARRPWRGDAAEYGVGFRVVRDLR